MKPTTTCKSAIGVIRRDRDSWIPEQIFRIIIEEDERLPEDTIAWTDIACASLPSGEFLRHPVSSTSHGTTLIESRERIYLCPAQSFYWSPDMALWQGQIKDCELAEFCTTAIYLDADDRYCTPHSIQQDALALAEQQDEAHDSEVEWFEIANSISQHRKKGV